MERLNNILGRTQSRRQVPSEQQAYHEDAYQAPRGQQPPQPVTRRQLPEQTARLGQKPSSTAHSQQPHTVPSGPPMRSFHRQGPASRYTNQEARHDINTRPPMSNQARQQAASDRESPYQQALASDPRRTQNFQTVNPRDQQEAHYPPQHGTRSFPMRSSSYYHADDYAPVPHADTLDEWDDEENEDEGNGMRYGDWEGDEPEVTEYRHADLEIIPHSRAHQPASAHESTAYYADPRVGRDMREVRQPTPISPQLVPAPQPSHRTQEVPQHQQRMTQPLTRNGQGRDFGAPRAPDMRRGPRPTRQLMPQEQHSRLLPPTQAAQLPEKTICPRCKGAGYLRANVPFGDPNFGKPIACECKEAERKEKRRQQLRTMSNLDAFRGQTFRTFNPRAAGVQEAFQASTDFAQEPDGWLVLVGPNGCGKTHLAAAIANQALESGAVVLFEAVPDLLDHLRAAFAPTASEVFDQLFSKMREAELLILDDLGAQQSSPWANEKLFQLLNYRYNMGMPTVITANPRGLQGVDERIRSRINDHSLVVQVHMDRAHDYRPHNPRR